jgi:rhodanese-related sulfurtransferase
LAQDLEQFVTEHEAIVIDLRDPITYAKANVPGTNNLSQNVLRDNLDRIPKGNPILLISDDGQKGHVALRMLKGAGFDQVFNLSGGYISLERYERAIGFERLQVGLFPVERKSVEDLEKGGVDASAIEDSGETAEISSDGPIILDVRTPMEFSMGAYPDAINVGLDGLQQWAQTIDNKDRKIIIYCASGARSSYGMRILSQLGFTNVENGGGLHDMMSRG